eukprot:5838396-Amphidinium_carterae.1
MGTAKTAISKQTNDQHNMFVIKFKAIGKTTKCIRFGFKCQSPSHGLEAGFQSLASVQSRNCAGRVSHAGYDPLTLEWRCYIQTSHPERRNETWTTIAARSCECFRNCNAQ